MYLLFVLDRQDILPIEDGAFLQSYKWLYKTDDISKISIEKKCKKMETVFIGCREILIPCFGYWDDKAGISSLQRFVIWRSRI